MNGKQANCSVALGLLLASMAFAETRVDFELVTEPGFPLGGERKWLEMMGELPGATVRIRSGRGSERPDVTRVARDRFQVVGILNSRNQLYLTGGTFGIADRRRITDWMQRLGEEGAEGLTAARGPFGLTEEQLVDLHERLSAPLNYSTKSLSLDQLVSRVAGQAKLEAAWIPENNAARRQPVMDEFEGLSAGTSLALAVRPYGLSIAPERKAGRTRLTVVLTRPKTEYWPTGWPAERPPKDTVPDLFKFLNVEIHDTPVAETLSAIEERVQVRFLYDHNAIAQHRIDLKTTKASIPSGRTYYKSIIDKVLFKATLRCEVRTDEAGTSFLWITR